MVFADWKVETIFKFLMHLYAALIVQQLIHSNNWIFNIIVVTVVMLQSTILM